MEADGKRTLTVPMVRHHQETVEAFTRGEAERPETLGVVVVGSVARGEARPDSDVDVYVVVTDEAYAAAERAGRVAYISQLGVGYEGGYVDVKLASPHYLAAAADRGDDPTRASFDGGRVTLDRVGDLAAVVARICALPAGVWASRIRTYRAQLALYGDYFLPQAYERGDRFLLQHSAVHASLAAGRCASPDIGGCSAARSTCPATFARLSELPKTSVPETFLPAWRKLVADPSPSAAGALIALIDAWLGDPLTVDEALSTFISTDELGWLNATIPPEYW